MYSVSKMYIISVDKRSVVDCRAEAIIKVFRKALKNGTKYHIKYFPNNFWNLEVISYKITF